MLASCGDSVEVEPYNKSGTGNVQQPAQTESDQQDFQQQDIEGATTDPTSQPLPEGYIPPIHGVVEAEAFHNFMHQTMPFQLVDVRDATAFNSERIEMNGPTLNIPLGSDFMKMMERVDRGKTVMFYDQDGRQASRIVEEAHKAGLPTHYVLSGGIASWKRLEYGHLTGSSAKAPEFSIDKLEESGVSNFKSMDLEEWHNSMHQMSQKQILDVRSPTEYANGYILESVNYDVDRPNFKNQINTLVKHQPVMVYGSNAAEATRAATILKDAGFQVIYDLASSFEEFKNKGFGHIGPEAPEGTGN